MATTSPLPHSVAQLAVHQRPVAGWARELTFSNSSSTRWRIKQPRSPRFKHSRLH